jgi:ketosteroid isomerase-like protein
MSEENVEIVRRVFEAAARRATEAVLALYDPEVEFDNTHGPAQALMGGRRVYHGYEGLRAIFREWYEAWDEVEADLKELIDAGERVISVQTYRGRGRASGAEVQWPDLAGVWTIHEGKIVRVAWFPTRAAAVEAAGASEEHPTLQKNVEIVRHAVEVFQQGDAREPFAQGLVAPDARWHPAAGMLGANEAYEGPDGFARFVKVWTEDFSDWSLSLDEARSVGDDHVLAIARQTAKGEKSGVPIEMRFVMLFKLRDSAITDVRVYGSRAEALEAAGVSE